MRMYSKGNCVECGEEYTLTPTKPGKINECRTCGSMTEEEKGNQRIGGVMHYPHKTTGQVVLMTLSDAKTFKRKTDRVGGQGIIKGMAERR